MRRREFIKLLSSTAAAWPLTAKAQQPAIPVIGFLRSSTLADATNLMAAFRQGLQDTGYVEGQNVATEYRFAENDRDKLTALVKDFIHRPVAVFVGNLVAALAAKAASTTVPIVFATGTDPVKDGLVTNLNRPGGNVTGVSFFAAAVGAKRLGQLRQLVPSATTIGVLDGPDDPRGQRRRGGCGASNRAAAHCSQCLERQRNPSGVCNLCPARSWCADYRGQRVHVLQSE